MAYGAAAGTVAVAVLAGALVGGDPVSAGMLVLGAVVLVAARSGPGPTVASIVLGLLAFNYFFVPPRFTFYMRVQSAWSVVVMGVVTALVGALTLRVRARADAARAREKQFETLYRLGRDLLAVHRTSDVLRRGVSHVADALGAHVLVFLPDETGRLGAVVAHGRSARTGLPEQALALRAYEEALACRSPAGVHSQAGSLYLPLSAAGRTVGVVALGGHAGQLVLTPEDRHLLEALLNQIALALLRSDGGVWIGARDEGGRFEDRRISALSAAQRSLLPSRAS